MKPTFISKLFIVVVLLLGLAYAMPNILKYEHVENSVFAKYLPSETVNLGLDLQGGSHLVLEVDLNEYFKTRYQNLTSDVRKILSKEKLRYKGLKSNSHGVFFTSTKEDQIIKIKNVLLDKIHNVYVDLEGNKIHIIYTEEEMQNLTSYAIGQTLEILRSRVDQFGVSEPIIQPQGHDRIIIELPGVKDSKTAKDLIGKTAQLNFHLVDKILAPNDRRIMHPPAGKIVSYEVLGEDLEGNERRMYYLLEKRAVVSGENLADARSGFTPEGESNVSIAFDSKGSRQFARVTTDYVGRNLAIVLDGITYSAPKLNEPIISGRASITGNFTVQEAESLAIVLRAGALPAPVKIVEERTVGPSLGADSIEASRLAIIYGFALVLLTMLVVYRGMGVIANIALLCNVVLILALMSIIQATLTLPGIAGIVLTMGMAVDANVLIFERIKEELKAGASRAKALDIGFNSALSTIFDANITTLIAAIVLIAVGSGPIKGFAVTLSIGIVSSVFTAVMMSRWLLESTQRFTIKEVKGK